jgi:hypothetical protein
VARERVAPATEHLVLQLRQCSHQVMGGQDILPVLLDHLGAGAVTTDVKRVGPLASIATVACTADVNIALFLANIDDRSHAIEELEPTTGVAPVTFCLPSRRSDCLSYVGVKWCGWRDFHPQRPAWKAGALNIELHPR